MTATALKKQFGLNTFELKFIGIKDFMTRNNIKSDNKYPPRLNFTHKNIINKTIVKSLPKKQQTSAVNKIKNTLKTRIKNPPKTLYGKTPSKQQIDHINSVYKAELERW